MTNPEQSRPLSAEQELHTPELYEYRSVLEALYGKELPEDDIAYIGGVVEYWDITVPVWNNIEDIRRAYSELETFSEKTKQAKTLLEQAERILIDEHWGQADEAQIHGNAILDARPGQFYAGDIHAQVFFPIEKFLLTSDRASRAQMYAIGGDRTQLCQPVALRLYVDATRLSADEREAMTVYVAEQEITPF